MTTDATPTVHPLYVITRDGAPVTGILPTEIDVLAWFHRHTSQSMDYALRYAGYAVTTLAGHAAEPRHLLAQRKLRRDAAYALTNHADPQGCRDDLTRDNCEACALTGYGEHNEAGHGYWAPNTARWARTYVEAGRPIPEKWRRAFIADMNETNDAGEPTSYAEELCRDIATFGVRFTD